MAKKHRTPLLVGSALVVWVGTSLYLTGIAGRYDNAVISNPYYFWVFAPIELIFCWLDESERKPRKESRWSIAFCFFILTACAFFLIPEAPVLLYRLYVWWLAALGAGWLAVNLYDRSPYRRSKRPKAARSPIQSAAVVVLWLYLSFAAVTVLYLAVLRPVTVDEITPIGEAEGGEFISQIDSNHIYRDTGAPLGLYWFRSEALDYYYDVLTGEPVAYRRPGSLGYSPRYGD